MPKERCWDLLLGTAIWSFCSASSHAQLTKTICVSHSPLSDPCRVFTFTGTGMIKIPQTNICFSLHCFRMCCFRENPQTSIALHWFAVLQAMGTACGRSAVMEKGAAPRARPLSHTGQQNPDPVTHACDMSRHSLDQPPVYCTWPAT